MKMKKLVALVVTLVMAIGLVACGKAEKQTVTFTTSQNGMDVEMVIDAEGDNITKLTQTSTLPTKGYTKDQLQKAADMAKEKYDAIGGCTYTSSITDSEFKEVIIMDINKDTLKKLISANLLPVTNKDAEVLSVEETRKGLTGNGWKEK